MYQYLSDVQKRRFFNGVMAVIIFLSIYLGAIAINAFKENNYIGRGVYAVNTITVNGKGEVFAIPDTANFSFSVVEEGKTVKDAQTLASKKINSIIDALKALGVAEKDIKTIGYNSNPKYDYSSGVCSPQPYSAGSSGSNVVSPSMPVYCPPGKQVLTGYEVSQSISVKIRKTDDSGNILTKVGDLGASNISGLDFVIDDMDKVQVEARDKAIADAKDKASVLAKSLGVKLVKIVSYNENGGGPIYYAMDKGMTMSAEATPSVAPQVPVGQNDIISNVSITYEVE